MSKKSGCAGCPRLKAVAPPSPESGARNFWNSCPLQLEGMPETPCSMGKPQKNEKGRIVQEPSCPWWIDSEKDNFCFWKYVSANSTPDGKMDPLLQNEIAQLYGCSSTKIHFIVKEGIQKLQDGEQAGMLAELANEPREADEDPSAPPLESLGIVEALDSEDDSDA